jgi:hypothetical protein
MPTCASKIAAEVRGGAKHERMHSVERCEQHIYRVHLLLSIPPSAAAAAAAVVHGHHM